MAPSRIFLCLIGAFILGVFVRSFFIVPGIFFLIFGIFGVFCFCFGYIRKNKKLIIFGAAFIFAVFGIFRLDNAVEPPPEISRFFDQRIEIQGFVYREPVVDQNQTFDVEVLNVNNREIKKPFLVRVTARPYPRYVLGDLLSISGSIQKPENFDNFDYGDYLAKDGVFSVMRYPVIQAWSEHVPLPFGIRLQQKLFSMKRAFLEKIEMLFPEPHASLLAGLLAGEKRSMPQSLLDDFRQTGTTHIIALSGFNISIIAEALLWSLEFLLIPFSISFWISIFAIVLFTIMVGASASIVRAAVMGILVLTARKTSRLYDAKIALIVAAGIMVLWNPGIVRFDVGFQLSFAATAGLLFLSPRLKHFFLWISIPWIRETLVTTLSAQLFVLPLLIYYFGGVSLISPLANLLVLVLIPLTMGIGFLVVAFAFISSVVARVFAIVPWSLLHYELSVISFFAHIPFAYIEISNFLFWILGIVYTFLMVVIFRHKPAFKESNI